MKLASRALSVAAAAVVSTLAACSSVANPGPAANLQACKDFAAYKSAESGGSFPGAAAGNMSAFITNGPRNINPNIGEPLRRDLARLVAVAYDGNVYTIDSDITKATADCAAVKASNGSKDSPPGPPAGSQTAAQIVPALKSAMTSASSVHIVGTLGEGSQKVSINASLNGNGISGTFGEDGSTFVIVVAGGNAYVQVNATYLKTAGLPAADCSTLCGKYVQAPASDVAQFDAFTLSHVMHDMASALPSAAGDTTDVFKPATFEGHPVLQLIQAQDTIDVARTGTPYPLFLSNAAKGSGHGAITFSEWNSVPPVTAPTASQIVQA